MPLQSSTLTALPTHVPIDWFTPSFWNHELTVRERLNYMGQGPVSVALPLEEHCQTWEDCARWKNLSEDEFMASYGNAVLAQYNLPTEEERQQMEEWDEPMVEFDNEENGEEEEEEFYLPEEDEEMARFENSGEGEGEEATALL